MTDVSNTAKALKAFVDGVNQIELDFADDITAAIQRAGDRACNPFVMIGHLYAAAWAGTMKQWQCEEQEQDSGNGKDKGNGKAGTQGRGTV